MATLLVPTINDAMDDRTTTYYNGIDIPMSEMTGEHTFSYTAGASTVTMDDISYTLGVTKMFVIGDGFIVAASSNGITVFKSDNTQVLNNNKTVDVSITFNDGDATLTAGTTTSTATYTRSFCADPDGVYGAAGLTDSSTIYFEDYADLFTAQRISGVFAIFNDETATINGSEATYTATINTQANTDNKVQYISGKVTITDGTNTALPTYMVCKAEVTFQDSTTMQMGSILYIIPVLIFAALLVGAVGMISRRND